jgi:2-keto-3-deoxy-L-fuconate dehydrogenase
LERKAVITCADRYMGPAIKRKFESVGINVFASFEELQSEDAVADLVNCAGDVDIVVANFAEPPQTSPVHEIKTHAWDQLFQTLVHPLMYLIRAFVPQMLEKGSGKIIAVTSAAPIRGIANNGAYCAARGAQNGLIKAVGIELARENIQVNAIAQNYINNDTYYPDNLLDNPKFLDHVRRNVPTNKIGSAEETAELAAYLASENCRHIVGQLIPLAGGWAT